MPEAEERGVGGRRVEQPPRQDSSRLALTPGAARRDLKARHEARQRGETRSGQRSAQASRTPPEDPLSISASYFFLRYGLAAVSLAFPLVLIVGGGLGDIQASLSAYYHFSPAQPAVYSAGVMRDVFVGGLWVVGALLLVYRGYSRQEDIALDVAGVAEILIAVFPMDWPVEDGVAQSVAAKVHFASASIFFVAIAYVCVFRAQDTLAILRDARRRARLKLVYAGLGILMVAVPAAIYALHLLLPEAAENRAVLWIEIAGTVIFAVFWLVKSHEIRLIERE